MGLGLTSNAPPPLPASAADESPAPTIVVARPNPTADLARLEGASALAATTFVIPPPRWLTGRRQPTPVTARLDGLANFRVYPYQK